MKNKKIGTLIFIIGLISLLATITLMLFIPAIFTFILLPVSIILNIVGITLMSMKNKK